MDFVIKTSKGVTLLEVDEHQHRKIWYTIDNEIQRMLAIKAAYDESDPGVPVRFVRFNPHGHRKNGVLERRNNKWRIKQLLHELVTWSPQQQFEVLYMYYDTNEGKLTFLDNNQCQEEFECYLVPSVT